MTIFDKMKGIKLDQRKNVQSYDKLPNEDPSVVSKPKEQAKIEVTNVDEED